MQMKWSGSMLFKKLIRTTFRYKAQFVSMILMVALGIGIFLGFNMEWKTIEVDTNNFYEQTNFADYRLYNEEGFSINDANQIKDIDGVSKVSRFLNVNVDVKNESKSLAINVCEDYVISTMLVTSGIEYDSNSKGIWLSDKFAEKNGYSLGDTIVLTYLNKEISGEIVGLCKASEYLICVGDSNQLLPDYSSFGFAYITPKLLESALGFSFYSQIRFSSSRSKVDLEDDINARLGKTTLLVGKDDIVSYSEARGEMEEGQTMGSILPVLFLAIAILTMITTMHRICANEKIQIGTLKALGFRDKRILFHYTSYGLFIGVVGSLLGVVLGYGVCYYIMNPNGSMGIYFDMPNWDMHMPWFCVVIVLLIICLLTLISFLSVKSMLNGTASDALRVYSPKKMKKLKIEKIKFMNRLSFGARWNLRDIFRHKSRTLMSLIGVIGCMLLLVASFGMKDTMDAYIKKLDEVNNYNVKVNLVQNCKNEDAIALNDELNGDWVSESAIKLNDKNIVLDIYSLKNNKLKLLDKNNNESKISNDGAYICMRLSEKYKVGDYIEFSPYGSNEVYEVKVVGVLRSIMNENIVMMDEYADKLGIKYSITSIYTDKESIPNYSFISSTQKKSAIMDSYDTFMELMNSMIWILVFAAVILGVIVLYNLGVMSYVERYNELATLKVVGFNDCQISKILISQNVWITALGIILGLPIGVGVLSYLIKALASEYELKLVLGEMTYIMSIVLTLVVALMVSYIISLKNKKIDMVSALKCCD